jgi:formylglycine-generating enzyme required for sulfatase activity
MSNESFLNYAVNRDVIHDYLRLLADKNIKERNGNILLAEKLRLSEDSFATLQQELLIAREQLALMESNQLPSHKKKAADKEIKQDKYGDYFDWVVQGVTQRFRWIPSGSFLMGSPKSEAERSSDETQHRVAFEQGFWMADTACTQALWQAVMGNNPAKFTDNPENPVEQVSWDDVQIFLKRIHDLMPEMVMRLPSEAEWEYACRAGTTSAFSFGMEIDDDQINYDSNFEQTVPVKVAPANPWGLYQMHGNVWEWCQDCWDTYANTPTNGSAAHRGDCNRRVLRGGSWNNYVQVVRSAFRGNGSPGNRIHIYGFRLAHS